MTPPPRLAIPRAALEALLERAKAGPLREAADATLKAAGAPLGYLTALLADRTTTLQRLRHLLFGARTETTRTVCPPATTPEAADGPAAEAPAPAREASRPGHGRKGARMDGGARQVAVPHATFTAGDHCPECRKGTVYPQREPAFLVRVVGQAPLSATVYALERFRCNLCGEVFPAAPPAGVGSAKYDASAGSMVALRKYGSGVPFRRLAQLQGSLGIPLPAATQWEIVAEVAAARQPAYAELIRQAAQGEVLHNDDTRVPILAFARAATDAGPGGRSPASSRGASMPARPWRRSPGTTRRPRRSSCRPRPGWPSTRSGAAPAWPSSTSGSPPRGLSGGWSRTPGSARRSPTSGSPGSRHPYGSSSGRGRQDK